MQELKTGLNVDKFANFWMFPERFYHSFVLQMTLKHSRRKVASRLARLRKNTKTCESG